MNRFKNGCWRYLSKSNINTLPHFHPNILQNPNPIVLSRRFGTKVDHQLSRDFFVNLWLSDSKIRNPRCKKSIKCRGLDLDPRWFSASSLDAVTTSKPKRNLKQPPISQSVSEFSKLESPEEAKLAPLLASSNLLITRVIEWANLVLGFEQENRYAVVDACYPQSVSENTDAVKALFGIELNSRIYCQESNQESSETESVYSLKCHISQEVNHLHEGLKHGLKSELEKASAALGRSAIYVKESRINALPRYLTVQFVRFFWKRESNQKAKILRKVDYPLELDVYDLCSDELKKKLEAPRQFLRNEEGKKLGLKVNEKSSVSKENDVKMSDAEDLKSKLEKAYAALGRRAIYVKESHINALPRNKQFMNPGFWNCSFPLKDIDRRFCSQSYSTHSRVLTRKPPTQSYSTKSRVLTTKPPSLKEGEFELYVEGGKKKDERAIAGVLYNFKGEVVFCFYQYFGGTTQDSSLDMDTSLDMECTAIKVGVKQIQEFARAEKTTIKRVNVICDNSSAVEYIKQTNWQPKYKKFKKEIMVLKLSFDMLNFYWLDRRKNQVANELIKVAYKEKNTDIIRVIGLAPKLGTDRKGKPFIFYLFIMMVISDLYTTFFH